MAEQYVCPKDSGMTEDVLVGWIAYKVMSDEERGRYLERCNPAYRPEMNQRLLGHLLAERCDSCRKQVRFFLLLRSVIDEEMGDTAAIQRMNEFRTETELFETSRN